MRLYIKNPESKLINAIEVTKLDMETIAFSLDGQIWESSEANVLAFLLSQSVNENKFERSQANENIFQFRTIKGISNESKLDFLIFLIQQGSQVQLSEKEAIEQAAALHQLNLLKKDLSKQIINSILPPASKHKKIIDSLAPCTTIKGKHTHRVYLTTNNKNEPCIVKDGMPTENSELEEFTAFFGQLAQYALGTEHAANTHCLVDEFGIARGTQQKQIKGFKPLAIRLKGKDNLPSQEELIKAGLIEAMAASFVFIDPDMHLNNICLDENNNIVLFDFDRWLFPLSCIFHGFFPNESIRANGKIYPAPNELYPITSTNLKLFPLLADGNHHWWLFSEIDGSKNPELMHLQGLDKNPETKYRVFKFFLRVCLLERSTLETFANVHIRNPTSQKKLIDFIMNRLNDLKTELLKLEEFKNFLDLNPLADVIRDLQNYNNSFKEKNNFFRVDIDQVKKSFAKKFINNHSTSAVLKETFIQSSATSENTFTMLKWKLTASTPFDKSPRQQQPKINEVIEDLSLNLTSCTIKQTP